MMPTDIDAQSDIEAAHPQAPIPPAKVLRAVEEIVNSRLFRTSPQCQKLLRYVVVHTLEGKEEELKEGHRQRGLRAAARLQYLR
jgi:hypothetical protein